MTKRITGQARQRRNRAMLKVSDVCHICGHAGSDAIDHVVPLKPRPGEPQGDESPANLRPAHHDVPCPTCGELCNRVKTNKPYAPIIRRSNSLRRRG